MNQFQNKVIWITGASSGIGEEMAYFFAKRNARLVLSARRVEELERVKKSCECASENILLLPFDLAHTENAESLAKQVFEHFGSIDFLINNGGVSQRATAMETKMENVRHFLEVNFFSYVALSKAVLPYMQKQKSGQITVISSIAGKFGFYLRSSYSAAKHALHGYFESLRLEEEVNGIKVLIVCPGKIKTSVSLNAITANGSKHNTMDESHADAMSAEICALQVAKAIEQGKEEVLIGGKELWMVHIRRFFPGLFRYMLRRVKRD